MVSNLIIFPLVYNTKLLNESNRLIIHTNLDEETGNTYLSTPINEYLNRRKNFKNKDNNFAKDLLNDKNALNNFYQAVEKNGYSTELVRTTMKDASDEAKDYALQMENGKGSVDDFTKSQIQAHEALANNSKLTSSFKSQIYALEYLGKNLKLPYL